MSNLRLHPAVKLKFTAPFTAVKAAFALSISPMPTSLIARYECGGGYPGILLGGRDAHLVPSTYFIPPKLASSRSTVAWPGGGREMAADQPAREPGEDRGQGRVLCRYALFQIAGVAVPKELFEEILRLIDGLRPLRAPSVEPNGADASSPRRPRQKRRKTAYPPICFTGNRQNARVCTVPRSNLGNVGSTITWAIAD